MTDATHETPELELQLLTAQDGTAYLFPRALVEAARLTPEDAACLRAQAGADDVHGYIYRVRVGPSAGAELGQGALAQQILAGNSAILATMGMEGISPDQIFSPTRKPPISHPKQFQP